MNTATAHDRQLALKLKSLSLEPVALGTGPSMPSRQPERRRSFALGGVAILAIAGVAALALPTAPELFHADPPAPAGGDQIAPAPTDPAAPKAPAPVAAPATREITGSGHVVAPRSAEVFSRYEGRIVAVAVEVGDRVEAGQLLVRLDDSGARFKLRQTEIAEASARLALAARDIDFAQASATSDRAATLFARGAASRQQLEDAQTLRQRAANSLDQAAQDLARAVLDREQASDTVDELIVVAPIAGTVTVRNARLGESVLARADSVKENASLLTIVDTRDLAIDADIAETSIALVRTGLHGEAVLDGFPDQPFEVTVDRIAPAASAEKGTVALRLSLVSPPAGIRPNMGARISIAGIPGATASAENRKGAQQ
ncbi:MAG: efflux RND transporter periplasmic adaptor subunit [Mesorhizobium sp.]|uniref:efflux RND transporter periplasmic adaptor subunit n=1 Tax=Mesorhizobium sp. TaxID=1871066 RepID=UPI001ACE2204|nr:efflux RND transporter periplasmic adaptor subunit [Mesorhizobium sp.]MBN9222239.1 efflux RND transporter periplasmic adaptor subunit [Mesorhizobium sp.]